MILRNKKTGEIVDGECFTDIVKKLHDRGDDLCRAPLLSLDLFKEYWEEIDGYRLKEPLIKDEKIRKAVQAFSEAIQEKKHILVIKQSGLGMAEFSNGSRFWVRLPLNNETMDALEDRTYYTIDELCGEEEE